MRIFKMCSFIGFCMVIFLFCIKYNNGGEGANRVGNEKDSLEKLHYAFLGAEGFGRDATGGRGGKVYYVTKLGDDGSPGTLRYAINKQGPRYILFKISGNIALESELHI